MRSRRVGRDTSECGTINLTTLGVQSAASVIGVKASMPSRHLTPRFPVFVAAEQNRRNEAPAAADTLSLGQ
jgi:hypothetical protein